MAKPAMARILFTTNSFPRCLRPNNKKGRFTIIRSNENGQCVSSVMINEIPVTPPSIKRLGNKNPFSPKAADKTPRLMTMK